MAIPGDYSLVYKVDWYESVLPTKWREQSPPQLVGFPNESWEGALILSQDFDPSNEITVVFYRSSAF